MAKEDYLVIALPVAVLANWRKILWIGVMAILALLMLYANSQRKTIIVLSGEKARIEERLTTANREVARLNAELLSWQDFKKKLAGEQEASAREYAEQQRASGEAMAQLRSELARSKQGTAAKQKVIEDLDAVCKATQDSLDTYCKGAGTL